jgi:hypothetical protein
MPAKSAAAYREAIKASGMTIYSPVEVGDDNYWIPTEELEQLLNAELAGKDLAGLALRTRSKVVKTAVCEALGYPVPKSFTKVQPRFSGQQLDTYAQKALNLQVWNEELSPTRRYAILQVTEDDKIGRVRVVNGQQLAILDTTGTITTKYQARLNPADANYELIVEADTELLAPHVKLELKFAPDQSPVAAPATGQLRPISEIFRLLSPLVGTSFSDPGRDQERNRGAALHAMVCKSLGYSRYEDTGQFPDVAHQLLEVKLQTSPTIDLGLVLPNSEDRMDIGHVGDAHPRHCDTRYALFFATTDNRMVTIRKLYVTTGQSFFNRFPRFEGRVKNGKIQMHLPRDFFSV